MTKPSGTIHSGLMRYSVLVAWLAVMLCVIPLASVAQSGPDDSSAESTASSDPLELYPTGNLPPEPNSPRASMMIFLRGLNNAAEARSEGDNSRADDYLRRVLETLDLSEFSQANRLPRGTQLARTLKEDVIDKFALIDYTLIPAYEEGPPFDLLVSPAGRRITLARNQAGQWQFTADSISQISAVAAEFESRERIEGVTSLDALVSTSELIVRRLPDWMKRQTLTLYLYQWIGIGLLSIMALTVGRALVYLLIFLAEKKLEKLGIQRGERQRYLLNWPLGFIFAVLIWWWFEPWLALPAAALRLADFVTVVMMGLSCVVFLVRLINVITDRLAAWAASTPNKYDDLLVPFVRKTAKIIVVAIGTLAVLDSLGVPLGAALGTLAIGGLAVSLAGKETIANVFGTITVIVDRPFEIGDWVVIDGHEGMVETLGFRSTRVRTFYNSLITIPNSLMISAVVDNYGARHFRRYMCHLNITYDTPPEKVDAFCEGIRELIRQHPYTRKDNYHIYFHGYGAHSLDILIYIFFKTPEWGTELRERHRFNIDILRLAHRIGVEFAFPTQKLYLERGTGPARPDRRPIPEREAILEHVYDAMDDAREIVHKTTGPPGYIPPPVTQQPPPENIKKRSMREGSAGEGS